MPTAEVNGARLWYEEAGEGPAVVLVHGGLGDSRLWEPEFAPLAGRFRTIRFDLRFFGRSTGPAAPFSWVDDLVGLLDERAVERAALVGLSFGGRVAIDAALAAPERCWAVVGVAPALSGHDSRAMTDEQDAAYDAAIDEHDLERAMAVDFEVWAPLGADDHSASCGSRRPTPSRSRPESSRARRRCPHCRGSRSSRARRSSSRPDTTRPACARSARCSSATRRTHATSRSTRTTT